MSTTIRASMIMIGLLALGGVGHAEKAAKQNAVDPEAIAALEHMSLFLRQQQNFTVDTKTETDYILDSGQTIRLSAHGEVRVKRPDHLRAEVTSDRKQRQFFYDGRTFTMYGQLLGFYASVPAPATIGETADMLEQRYGLELPLVDLFRWGSDEADFSQITSASFVGRTQLDGVDVDQYAFSQPGVDWQIWIERGERPLPRKLLLTTTDDPARPDFEIAMTWKLGTKHEDSEFIFTPPKGSMQIALAELTPQPARKARRSPRAPRSNK